MANQPDHLIAPGDHPIRLPAFEGPLDLLLYLIRKNEIEIYDIPIARVTDQYLEILHGMERLNLESAGDFFVMAATLMQIKSRMLLPKEQRKDESESPEEGVDPRWELVRQLVEYRKFKEAAEKIDSLISQTQDLLPRQFPAHANLFSGARPLQKSDKVELWNTFNAVLRRLAEKMSVGQIHAESITVADQMEQILERLRTEPVFRFSELLAERPTISPLFAVATFLAILELARLGHITITQEVHFADILCQIQENHVNIASQ